MRPTWPKICSGDMYSGVPRTVPTAVPSALARHGLSVATPHENLRDAEVHDLEKVRPVFAVENEDIVRLEIAMDDAVSVRGGQPA
jgi:hypothetical protein